MFCPKCGAELPNGASFCVRCGNAVSTSQPSAVPRRGSGRGKVIVALVAAAVVVAVVSVAAVMTRGFGLISTDVPVRGSVEEYSWAELSAISEEIGQTVSDDAAIEVARKYHLVNDDGTLDGTQRKSVTLTDGTVTSVQIVGFAHDEKSDGSGRAGITFIFTDGIALHPMNEEVKSEGGWESCDMRPWLASEGKALLPQDLQNELVPVEKLSNDAWSVVTTSDELWLFSHVELAGTSFLSSLDSPKYESLLAGEGSQYKLFSDQGVSTDGRNEILVKSFDFEEEDWWTRTAAGVNSVDNSEVYVQVYSGNPTDGGDATTPNVAVVPGFCV